MDMEVQRTAVRFIKELVGNINNEIEIPKVIFLFQPDAYEYFKKRIFSSEKGECISEKEFLQWIHMKKHAQIPVIEIYDYQLFFETLHRFMKALMVQRIRYHDFITEEELTFYALNRIWLRMTPSDFRKPIQFLQKQLSFVSNYSFARYHEEIIVGKFLDYSISVQDQLGMTYDENNKAMQIRLLDADDYQYHTLPLIRYDIHQEENICYIGAIQNKEFPSRIKRVERALYRLNKGIEKDDMENVYNGSLLSLMIFINLLKEKGIDHIRVPILHVLSYDYHKKIEDKVKDSYDRKRNKPCFTPEEEMEFEYTKSWYEKTVGKNDFISKAKTENLLSVFQRLTKHYPFVNITNEPWITGDYLDVKINWSYDDEIYPEILSDVYMSMNKKQEYCKKYQ